MGGVAAVDHEAEDLHIQFISRFWHHSSRENGFRIAVNDDRIFVFQAIFSVSLLGNIDCEGIVSFEEYISFFEEAIPSSR